jgi:capsular polysaccharide biosynthesis protein
MELKDYWRIVWRRWWLVVGLVGLVLVISLLTIQPPATTYVATMRFAVGIEGSEPVDAPSGEGRSDAWLASEYLADDLSAVVKGGDFAARISERVGFPVPAGALSASREHRIMTVTLGWPDPTQAQVIAEAVAAELETAPYDYFPQLRQTTAEVILIDGPAIGPVGPSLTQRLDLPLRLIIALVAGIALTFLWHYLDNTVRDRREVEALGMEVLGEIPRKHRF